MAKSGRYSRCAFYNGDNQCETWFEQDSDDALRQEFCPFHQGMPAVNGTSQEKGSMLDIMRNEALAVAHMTPEQIGAHIASIEIEIEKLKARTTGARSARAGKLSDLTESERAERRKIKIGIDGQPEPPKLKRAAKPAKPTFASDPIAYFMNTMGVTREAAEAMHKELSGI